MGSFLMRDFLQFLVGFEFYFAQLVLECLVSFDGSSLMRAFEQDDSEQIVGEGGVGAEGGEVLVDLLLAKLNKIILRRALLYRFSEFH